MGSESEAQLRNALPSPPSGGIRRRVILSERARWTHTVRMKLEGVLLLRFNISSKRHLLNLEYSFVRPSTYAPVPAQSHGYHQHKPAPASAPAPEPAPKPSSLFLESYIHVEIPWYRYFHLGVQQQIQPAGRRSRRSRLYGALMSAAPSIEYSSSPGYVPPYEIIL